MIPVFNIAPVNTALREALQQKIDNKTKPTGALGQLESIALQAGLVQNSLSPQINNPHIIVFAADHGIAATGLVNPYPQAVTAQMVYNFLNGGAAINVFCRQHGIGLTIADAGVNHDFNGHNGLHHAKIAPGTRNYLEAPAMTMDELADALQRGAAIVQKMYEEGCNCIGFGEMGIGNSSSAALLLSAVTGMPVAQCAGRGTGVDDVQLQTKITTLEQVMQRWHRQDMKTADMLCCFGGFEIAMMTGAYLQAAALQMLIVVDGFIATAALLMAQQLNEEVSHYCIFAHCSEEQAHRAMLDYLQAKPLLQLSMRLGEGTGAALAMPLVQAAVNFLNEMASFESAQVTQSGKVEE